MSDRIAQKLARIRGGSRPRLLDMFSGCGGFTLGFQRAGFQPVGGLDLDENATRSYAHNFHPEDVDQHLEPEGVEREGGAAALDQVRRRAGQELDPREAIDVFTAGPPCPTFSQIGRAKLNFPHDPKKVDRGTFESSDLFLDDERNDLFHAIPAYAEALEPVAMVVENVPGFLSQRGTNHGRKLASMLEDLGYEVAYTLLNSAAYGVPQWRERFFLIAIHRLAGTGIPSFPVPDHTLAGMPAGMMGVRKGAITLIPGASLHSSGQLTLMRTDHWVPVPVAPPGSRKPVSVGEAIGDLPSHDPSEHPETRTRSEEWKDGERRGYTGDPSPFALKMRAWAGPDHSDGIWAAQHIARNTTSDTGRDRRIFERMSNGDGYPQAIAIAERLLENAIEGQGGADNMSDEALEAIRARYVPPYPVDKFVTKWQRLRWDSPSHTLTAHLSKDTYSHIHPGQPRMITVQEAARLQSFPDSFRFCSSMSGAFRQIGNSVPPLLSNAIGRSLLEQLSGTAVTEESEPALAKQDRA
ncbi:DNA cytosine methyltransferase [bacterium]|nr:DNA cytosine methyltransferase [bacterium]